MLRADQGLDVRVGHVRGASDARVPGRRGVPLPSSGRRTAHVSAQADHHRCRRDEPGPLQRGRDNRFARPAHRKPGARDPIRLLCQLIDRGHPQCTAAMYSICYDGFYILYIISTNYTYSINKKIIISHRRLRFCVSYHNLIKL